MTYLSDIKYTSILYITEAHGLNEMLAYNIILAK